MAFTSSALFKSSLVLVMLGLGLSLGACSQVNVPDARNVDIPSPVTATPRRKAVNERPDSVIYLPLGDDILVPEIAQDDPLPYEMVGPFELRNETLAGALQLILADYDIGIAFETDAAMTRHITVANLSGELSKVVKRVCSLADLYCSFEDGTLIVKETQTFTVTLPPIGNSASSVSSSSSSSSSSSEDGSTSSSSLSGMTGGGNGSDYLGSVSSGLAAILGTAPIADSATRTLVYSASQRTSQLAERYFQRLRANTAMIVYETYIWEVSLDAGNSAGIDWDMVDEIGKFSISAAVSGNVASDFTNPISIGLPTTGSVEPSDFIRFLSKFGAVKTISQPQITVLSGASAEMRVADTQNYVSEISTTFNDSQSSTSVSTDTVDSGFTLTIGSSWDKATVYTTVNIEITDILAIDDFSVTGSGDDDSTTRIQLPQTTERELNTQIRVRPGDSVLIGGLVRERDNFNKEGPGFMEPIVPQSRTAQSNNLELVIMMRPRVVVYTDLDDARYVDYSHKKAAIAQAPVIAKSVEELEAPAPVATSVTPAPVETKPLPVESAPIVSPAPAPAPVPAPSVAPVPVAAPPPEPVPSAPTPVTSTVAPVQAAPVSEPTYNSIRPPRLSGSPASPPAASDFGARSSAARSSEATPSVTVSPVAPPSQQSLNAPTPITQPSVMAPNSNNASNYVSPYETYEYYTPKN